jgi:hypothetical protein
MSTTALRSPLAASTLAAASWAGALGLVAVLGNVLGVVFLRGVPGAYRLAGLDAWVGAVALQPAATLASALSFTAGLFALAGWARHLGAQLGTPLTRGAAHLIALTALLNGAAALLPVVQSVQVGACGVACAAVGRALLGMALTFDALFNLGLGLGLLLIALDGASARLGSLRVLAALSGLASLPVAGQALWDGSADALYVAGPLWLAFITKTSLDWLRQP